MSAESKQSGKKSNENSASLSSAAPSKSKSESAQKPKKLSSNSLDNSKVVKDLLNFVPNDNLSNKVV
jgi:hypothetical protein